MTLTQKIPPETTESMQKIPIKTFISPLPPRITPCHKNPDNGNEVDRHPTLFPTTTTQHKRKNPRALLLIVFLNAREPTQVASSCGLSI